MRYLVLLLAVAGCATDPLVDPVGNWDTQFTWTSGTCQLTGTVAGSPTTVTRSGNGYVISSSGAALRGTVLCSPESCHLSFWEMGPGAPGSGIESMTLQFNLTVDSDDVITGGGSTSVRFADGRTCAQAFAASGRLR